MLLLQCSTQPADSLGSDGSALSGVEGMAERLWEELILRMLQQSPDAQCLGSEIGSPDGANQRDKWRGRAENNMRRGGEERK